MTIIAYTDGACKGNGKTGEASAGGFGTHIIYPTGDILNIWGGESNTTNNRMELMGAITALERKAGKKQTEKRYLIWICGCV